MIIRSIKLSHFRNYSAAEVFFHEKINVFIGENGAGKTNLLESIQYLSTIRSFRVKDEQELIAKNQEVAKIEGTIENDGILKKLAIIIRPEGKVLLFAKQPVKKSSEFIGQCNAVLFSPVDMDFFEALPKVRRRLMDVELSKISPFYMEQLVLYGKLLKERNNYLKQDVIDEHYLEVLDSQLIDSQLPIIKWRKEFIDYITNRVEDIFSTFMGERRNIDIQHMSPVEDTNNNVLDQLTEKFKQGSRRDRMFKLTHIGVHRDDLIVTIDQFPVTSYASQGQKRALILSIKIALLEYIKHKTDSNPILLLDDVFSELDERRRKIFYQVLPKQSQIMITSTKGDEINEWPKKDLQMFEILKGSITPLKEDYP